MTCRFYDNNATRMLWIIILVLVFCFSGVPEAEQVLYGQKTPEILYESPFRSRPTTLSGPVQTEYPAIGKIVGRGNVTENKSNHQEMQWVYYGSGVYVAELNDFGVVITNWHVVSQSDNSIKVVFPNYTSEGVVLLADEVWDLAAVVIRRPSFLPIPISLEVPQVNDELWVGGYGPESGLDNFQLQAGKVLQYMTLGVREGLPVETIAIEAGVRQGDSGGPVLNKYGELAGILWGTIDGWTMCTFCLRLQAFLTQAQFQLINMADDADTFFRKRHGNTTTKTITQATTPAKTALQSAGIYPISTRPVYQTNMTAVNSDILESSTIPSVKGIPPRHPPYPPIESPTLLAQRQIIGRDNPEVYPESTPYLKKKGGTPRFVGVSGNEKQVFLDVASNSRMNISAPQNISSTNVSTPNVSAPQNVSIPKTEKGLNKESAQNKVPIKVPQTAKTSSNDNSGSGSVEDASKAQTNDTDKDDNQSASNQEEGPKEISPFFRLFNAKFIVVSIFLLFLFFNSLRFLSIASEK